MSQGKSTGPLLQRHSLKGLNRSSVFKEDKRQEVGANGSGVSLAGYHLSEYSVRVTK